MVIWIIDKSGVGKTYLAEKLYKILKRVKKKVIWIDGDRFRKKFSKDLGFSVKDRLKNSKRLQLYCKKYDKKGYIVLCSVISIFINHQKENRKKFTNYFQIHLKSEMKTLKIRNNKRIYSKSKNVVGKDIVFPTPYKSDLILKNKFDKNFIKNLPKIKKLIYAKL